MLSLSIRPLKEPGDYILMKNDEAPDAQILRNQACMEHVSATKNET